MIKYLFIFFSTFTLFSQTNNQKEVTGLIIDPTIKQEVENHIKESDDFGKMNSVMQVYENSILGEFFENDTLYISNDDITKKQLFKSFYYWKDGKLVIDGAFGLFGGIGFNINFNNNHAEVFHMLSSDDFPSYAYNEKDILIYRLEVPCTETKIILSELPDKEKKQLIYGYVEFNSNTYYSTSGSLDEGKKPPKKRYRNNMKIYFRCKYLEL
jgi:hypothetical protein